MIKLLSTAELPNGSENLAAKNNVLLTSEPFTDVIYLGDANTRTEFAKYQADNTDVIFTSKNAVIAAARLCDSIPARWNIYCMAPITAKTVQKYFPECTIKGTAPNADKLAELVIKDNVAEAVFFCGDNRLPVLPETLRIAGVNLHEMVVYNTVQVGHMLNQTFDGVLFFSPLAVISFFKKNRLPPQTVTFAIGATTAKAVRAHCFNIIITVQNPDKKMVLRKAIQYLQKL